jgi:2-polyprenyl-6-methoxyphenol hydroxylase-like FAD-dependent oxidoreductase
VATAGNTGIQDAYNLAWKIDAVIRRPAARALLDSYAERRPVADRTMAQALARLQAWFKDPSRKLPRRSRSWTTTRSSSDIATPPVRLSLNAPMRSRAGPARTAALDR